MAFLPSFRLSARSPALPVDHHREQYSVGWAARMEQPPFTHCRLDDLAWRLLEGHRVNEGRVVDMLSALEASKMEDYLVVDRSKPGEVVCTDYSLRKSVQQVLITSVFNMRTFRLRGHLQYAGRNIWRVHAMP